MFKVIASMETVFDFNPTREEIGKILNPYMAGQSKDEYLRYRSQEVCYRDIAALLWMRGEEAKARSYLRKTTPEMRRTFLLAMNGY